MKIIDFCKLNQLCVDFYLEMIPTMIQSGHSLDESMGMGLVDDDYISTQNMMHDLLMGVILQEQQLAEVSGDHLINPSYDNFLSSPSKYMMKYISPWRFDDTYTRNFFDNTLSALRLIFGKCGTSNFVGNKLSCDIFGKAFINLRVHNIDNRGNNWLHNPEDALIPNLSSEQLDQVLKWFLGIDNDPEKVKSLFSNEAFEELKLIKSNLLSKIEKFQDVPGLNLKHIKDILYKCYQNDGIYDELKFRAPLMDLYTMTRMLKPFKTDKGKQKRGPVHCRNSPNQDRIILYAGNLHINSYVCALTNLYPDSLRFSVPKSDLKILGIPIFAKKNGTTPLVTGTNYMVDRITKCIAFHNNVKNRDGFANFQALAKDFCLPFDAEDIPRS